jgi:hypothetical protein
MHEYDSSSALNSASADDAAERRANTSRQHARHLANDQHFGNRPADRHDEQDEQP